MSCFAVGNVPEVKAKIPSRINFLEDDQKHADLTGKCHRKVDFTVFLAFLSHRLIPPKGHLCGTP